MPWWAFHWGWQVSTFLHHCWIRPRQDPPPSILAMDKDTCQYHGQQVKHREKISHAYLSVWAIHCLVIYMSISLCYGMQHGYSQTQSNTRSTALVFKRLGYMGIVQSTIQVLDTEPSFCSSRNLCVCVCVEVWTSLLFVGAAGPRLFTIHQIDASSNNLPKAHPWWVPDRCSHEWHATTAGFHNAPSFECVCAA